MPQLQRFFCSNCKRPIDEIKIGSKLVPLVTYFVVGQPPDTGAPVDLDEGSGVKVPSFIREMMQPHVPVARVELCVPCLAELFGLKLYTAEDDPMFSKEQTQASAAQIRGATDADTTRLADGKAPRTEVEKHADTVSRALLAIKVGRGAKKAPALPKAAPKLALRAPIMPPVASPRAVRKAARAAKKGRVVAVKPPA